MFSLSGRPWRFRAANPKILWPILSRLPIAVKFGVLGVGGVVGLIVDVDESAATSRTAAAATSTSAAVKSAAMRLGLVAFAAEKPLKNAEDSNRFNGETKTSGRTPERLFASAEFQNLTNGVDDGDREYGSGNSNNSSSQGNGKKRVYKYFKNEKGENDARRGKKEVNDGNAEAREADLNGSNSLNSNNSIDDQFSLDGKLLAAAPKETRGSENCGKCAMGNALDRQPFVSNGMLGSEVEGLDLSMEVLALDNASVNAGEVDDDKESEDDFDQSKDSPFNKNIQVLVDEALRWNDRLFSEPSGECQPYDQIPEESFNNWVNDADRMFRERKFEDLKEKFEEEYKKTKGRDAKRDPQLCWRMARLSFLMGNEVENNTIEFWKEAMIYATEGIKNFEDLDRVDRVDDVKQINHNCCWKCHLWFGIIMAKLGGLLQKDQDPRKRFQMAFMAKTHLERAIQINSLDPIPHFALAKWHYEFCKLNAGQMKILREMGYGIPLTDIKTALRYAERANELSPKLIGSRVGKFPRNAYLMAEMYDSLGQKEKAKYMVHALVYQMAPFVATMEDRRAVERGKVLWMKLMYPAPNNPNDSTPRVGKARPQMPTYPDHHNNLFPPKAEEDTKK